MRACFGLTASAAIGVVVTLLTRPEPEEKQRGLVWGTIADAIRHYKGSPGSESGTTRATAMPRRGERDERSAGETPLAVVTISETLAKSLGAAVGDVVYVSDRSWWLGGLRSTHAIVGGVVGAVGGAAGPDHVVTMGPETYEAVVTGRRAQEPIVIERLY